MAIAAFPTNACVINFEVATGQNEEEMSFIVVLRYLLSRNKENGTVVGRIDRKEEQDGLSCRHLVFLMVR